MWQKVTMQSNLVKGETERAFLVKLPKSEFMFWYPKKLTSFKGKNDYLMVLTMKEDMELNIFKNGNGMYNKYEKIAEKTITYSELLDILNNKEV